MNKFLKSTLSVLLIGLMSAPIQAIAMTNASTKIDISNKETVELINKFSHFKESLEKNTNGKLVSSNDLYVKFTPKENIKTKDLYENEEQIKKDFNIESYTKEQYENVTKHKRTRRSSEYTNENSTSWLKVTLQVYQTNSSNEYMVYNFCSWLTSPKVAFGEAIAISVGDGLIINDDDSQVGSYEYYNPYNKEDGVGYEKLSIEQLEGLKGICANFQISTLPVYGNSQNFDNVMLQAKVHFNNNAISKAYVTGTYMHKIFGTPSVGISLTNGALTITPSFTTDSVSTLVQIKR